MSDQRRGNRRGRGGTNQQKRKRNDTDDDEISIALKNEIKRQKIAKERKEFFETHGQTWRVFIFKKSLKFINKQEFNELRAKLYAFQVTNNSLTLTFYHKLL